MTVKEVIETLSKYPPNMNVQVAVYRFISDVQKIDKIVDMDTNIVSVCLYSANER